MTTTISKASNVCACSHPRWQGACSKCIAKQQVLDRMDEQLNDLLGPPIDPITQAHNEYANEKYEQKYQSSAWERAQIEAQY